MSRVRHHGHEAIAASPSSGVDTLTGEGLSEVMDGASVVVDVASAVGRVAVGAPLNGMLEVAGPEQFRLDELIRGVLTARDDPRSVVTDPQARYYGINPSERALLPGPGAHVAETRFSDWRERQPTPA